MHDSTETASEEAKHLITETDDNKDGILSFKEIMNKYEMWVGSITDNKHTELWNSYNQSTIILQYFTSNIDRERWKYCLIYVFYKEI